MKKEDSVPKNIIYKKIDTNEIKNNNEHNYKISNNIVAKELNDSFEHSNKKNNKDLKLKSFNDKNLHKKSYLEKKKSNLVALSKSSNQNIGNKHHEKGKFITDSDNINLNAYINNSNAKFKNKAKKRNRYLTYFENSEDSMDNDESKINNLLNDFIKPNTIKNRAQIINKENVNLYSNLIKQKNENSLNKKNLIIKVNKKKYANNRPKNFYIQACLKLKEQQIDKSKNKDKNESEINLEESRKGNFLKLPKKNNERKRNVIKYSKLKQSKQNYSSIEKEINNSVRMPKKGSSLAKIQKSSNLFRVSDKKLFINSNYLRKQRTKPSSDFHTFRENKKSINKSCIEKEGNLKDKAKTSNQVINNYGQKKLSVYKQISSIPLKRNVINHNSFLSLENNNLSSKHNFKNNLRTKSEKNENMLNSISFNKQKNYNIKNLINNFNDNIYFSLDFSINNKNENGKNKVLNQKYILSPKRLESRHKKISSSVCRDRHKKQLSKTNTDASNFDIDELNKKLFRVIKNIEKQEEKSREIKKSDKNDDGFIKWDIFEKVIAEEN
jgi:hypothetical protein